MPHIETCPSTYKDKLLMWWRLPQNYPRTSVIEINLLGFFGVFQVQYSKAEIDTG